MGSQSLVLSDATAVYTSVATEVGSVLVASNAALAGVSPPAVSTFQALNPGTSGYVLTANPEAPLGVDWEPTGAPAGGFVVPSYLKASLPAVVAGNLIYVSDATGAQVTGSLCFGNTTAAAYIDVTTGIAVA